MAGQWHSNEEFEKDLNTFSEMSEIQENSDEDAMKPQTVLEYQAHQYKNNSSIFTDNFIHEDGVVYVLSGRGRGIASQIYAPGLKTAVTPTDEDDIKRRIRQEVGHVGYDELCYSKYKRINKIDERLFVNAPEQFLTQQLASTTSISPSKSNRGSPQYLSAHSSIQTSPQSLSDASRSSTPNNPTVSPVLKLSTSNSSPKKTNAVSQSVENMIVEEQEDRETDTTDLKPLPLSVMLRKAKKKPPEIDKKPKESPPKKPQSPRKNGEWPLNGKENGSLGANRNCGSDKTKGTFGSTSGPLDSSSSTDDDPWWGGTGPDNWRDRTTYIPKFFKGNNNPWRKDTKIDRFDVCSDKEFPPLQ